MWRVASLMIVAYLVGFAADCINQVRINKFRE